MNEETRKPRSWHLLGETWLLECENEPASAHDPARPKPDSRRHFLSPKQVEELCSRFPPASPSMFIFHVGHCGSTLLANLLGANNDCTSLVEPDFLGIVFARTHHLESARFANLARPVIACCGLGITRAKPLVLKFASHALHRVPEIQAAFPNVPCVLVYRDPLEVLVGHLQTPGPFLERQASWLGHVIKPSETPLSNMTMEDLCIQYSQSLFAAAARNVDRFTSVVNYGDLPGAVHRIREEILGLSDRISDQALLELTRSHSKDPQREFIDDGLVKKRAASERCKSAARHYLDPLFREIEAKRSFGIHTCE